MVSGNCILHLLLRQLPNLCIWLLYPSNRPRSSPYTGFLSPGQFGSALFREVCSIVPVQCAKMRQDCVVHCSTMRCNSFCICMVLVCSCLFIWCCASVVLPRLCTLQTTGHGLHVQYTMTWSYLPKYPGKRVCLGCCVFAKRAVVTTHIVHWFVMEKRECQPSEWQ